MYVYSYIYCQVSNMTRINQFELHTQCEMLMLITNIDLLKIRMITVYLLQMARCEKAQSFTMLTS